MTLHFFLGIKVIVSLSFFCLSGCDLIPHPPSETLLKKGWTKSEIFQKKPYYCYSTLGETMCYKQPLPNSQTRLTGQPYLYEKKIKNTRLRWYNIYPLFCRLCEEHSDVAISLGLVTGNFYSEKMKMRYYMTKKLNQIVSTKCQRSLIEKLSFWLFF